MIVMLLVGFAFGFFFGATSIMLIHKKRLPEFREYARQKYHAELDEDLIVMIEDIIGREKPPGLRSKPEKEVSK